MKQRNTPITRLIRLYTDKRSKMVMESRCELKLRFACLDWKDQRKILRAFLDSGKADRQWAYTQLLTYWDETFKDVIQACWEQYKEDRCAWLIIRYFPTEYLWEHFETLRTGRNYYFLCKRLVKTPGFVPDPALLSRNDYLSLCLLGNRTLTDEEARTLIFRSLYDTFTAEQTDEVFPVRRGEALSALHFKTIYITVARLKQLVQGTWLDEFMAWDARLQQLNEGNRLFHHLQSIPCTDAEYYEQRRTLFIRMVRQELTAPHLLYWERERKAYETELKHKMSATNPVLNLLLELE